MNKLMMHWLFKWYIYISALILAEPLENEVSPYLIQYYLCSSKISHILGDLWETKYVQKIKSTQRETSFSLIFCLSLISSQELQCFNKEISS